MLGVHGARIECSKSIVANCAAIGDRLPPHIVATSAMRWRATALPAHSPLTVLQQPVSHWLLNLHSMFGQSTVQSGQVDGI